MGKRESRKKIEGKKGKEKKRGVGKESLGGGGGRGVEDRMNRRNRGERPRPGLEPRVSHFIDLCLNHWAMVFIVVVFCMKNLNSFSPTRGSGTQNFNQKHNLCLSLCGKCVCACVHVCEIQFRSVLSKYA